jgi:hypothetical protein
MIFVGHFGHRMWSHTLQHQFGPTNLRIISHLLAWIEMFKSLTSLQW